MMAEGTEKENENSQEKQSNGIIRYPAVIPNNGESLVTTSKMNGNQDLQNTQLISGKCTTAPNLIKCSNGIDATALNHTENNNTLTDITLKNIATAVLEQNGITAAIAEAITENDSGSEIKDQNDRRHSKSSSLPHGVKLCTELTSPALSQDKLSMTGDSDSLDDKWANLEQELRKAQSELKAKDAEVQELKGIRQQVEEELDDLTASLFEEAHKMVKEAKMKEISSEKSLKEAKMQLEGLQAEVAALKTLLITSTPSRPNLGANGSTNGISIFKKQHKRYPSHNHLQYGRADEEPDVKVTESHVPRDVVIDRERCEIDPRFHELFSRWREDPSLNQESSLFLTKLYSEDIEPCLEFHNVDLVKSLRKAIEDNSIWVEPLPEKEKSGIAKTCALLRCPRVCHYRMRFAFDSDEWFDISQLCRDRIAAVCEFLNYLRYIKNGLVKASVDDTYWEIIRLRKQMANARLGIPIS